MTFPYIAAKTNVKTYGFTTGILSGSYSTPYFKQPFNENLFENIYIIVTIDLPILVDKKGKLIINVEYDIEQISWNEYILIDGVYLENTRTKFRKEYLAGNYVFIEVEYNRKMGEAYYRWNNKRNTGMNVSWHFEASEEENEYAEEYEYKTNSYEDNNKHFIHLANIIHEQNGVTDEMENLTNAIWLRKKEEESCVLGVISERSKDILYSMYGNVAQQPTYKDYISEETLGTAAEIYFRIAFCPYYDQEVIEFYQKLFQNSPPETVLKTLIRILFVANEKNLTEHYNIAKTLFDNTAMMMDLQYRDFAILTTKDSELELYQELEMYHKTNQNTKSDIQSKIGRYTDVERLLNQPVHITDNNKGLAAFIPFCSLGENLIGKKLGKFQACDLFHQKFVSGRLCYEADINQYIKSNGNLGDILNQGFGFIVDTNDEYDVKNIMKQGESRENLRNTSLAPYKIIENSNTVEILLNTISKYDIYQ